MLFGALGRWPYDYYKLLRWVTCAAAVFVVVLAVVYEKHWIAWPFGVVELAFNPVAPIHLTREIWAFLNVGAALGFLASIFVIWTKPSSTQTEKDQEHEALHP